MGWRKQRNETGFMDGHERAEFDQLARDIEVKFSTHYGQEKDDAPTGIGLPIRVIKLEKNTSGQVDLVMEETKDARYYAKGASKTDVGSLLDGQWIMREGHDKKAERTFTDASELIIRINEHLPLLTQPIDPTQFPHIVDLQKFSPAGGGAKSGEPTLLEVIKTSAAKALPPAPSALQEQLNAKYLDYDIFETGATPLNVAVSEAGGHVTLELSTEKPSARFALLAGEMDNVSTPNFNRQPDANDGKSRIYAAASFTDLEQVVDRVTQPHVSRLLKGRENSGQRGV